MFVLYFFKKLYSTVQKQNRVNPSKLQHCLPSHAVQHLCWWERRIWWQVRWVLCIHTMAIVQAYQPDLLRQPASSAAPWWWQERHLWLYLLGLKEKDKAFLLDAQLMPFGLFSDAVASVVERFQEAKKFDYTWFPMDSSGNRFINPAAHGSKPQCPPNKPVAMGDSLFIERPVEISIRFNLL